MMARMSGYSDIWYDSCDGLRLYARDYPGPGAGALPVLCLHGLTRNSADFAGLAQHLAATRRVIAVDQRGRGRSARDPEPARYTPATYVQDMFLLLDGLGLERVVLIGTSMGGLMAFIMAAMQPQRVAGMVINDIGPEIDPVGLARIQQAVGRITPVRTWEEAAAQARELNAVAFPDWNDDDWLAFARGLYREEGGVPVRAYDPAIAEPMAAPEDSGAVPPDLWPLFEQIAGIPMLVVRGELSDILARDCVERMRAAAPALAALEVPRVGHAPMLTEPQAVAAIDSFLRGLS
jgi:pimeloyl-ACP methyl ester carboxylesterase